MREEENIGVEEDVVEDEEGEGKVKEEEAIEEEEGDLGDFGFLSPILFLWRCFISCV